MVYIDTSGLYAVFDRDDANHRAAHGIWERLVHNEDNLITNNYVIVETTALLQHRLGVAAVAALYDRVLPVVTVDWLSAEQHHAAVSALLVASPKKLSVVDCTSFEVMRRRGIQTAFAFDRHFAEQGFELVK